LEVQGRVVRGWWEGLGQDVVVRLDIGGMVRRGWVVDVVDVAAVLLLNIDVHLCCVEN
jgi:hypothetical protein